MPKIERLFGREILDSRGKPTVLATCILEGGIRASASVPSGASTGAGEAFELRDGDPNRYHGLGCRRAVANIGGELLRGLAGRVFTNQADLDQAMIALDGTPAKSRLGANAILAVSVAFARASAAQQGIPLYQYFANMLGVQVNRLPLLTINLLSGGKHAGEQVSIQDVLIIPLCAHTADEALRGLRHWDFSSENAVMYFPRVLAHDKLRGHFESFGSCGAVAGMLARSDEAFPVWAPTKPEDAVLRPGYRPVCLVTEDLRMRLAARGVNTIQAVRSVARIGVQARTLAAGTAGAPDWQYLGARRLALFILNSIERSTRWAVLTKPHREVSGLATVQVAAFFEWLRAEGAFANRPVEDSYVVICDQRANPSEAAASDFQLLIGFAAQRGHEFHCFRISHSMAGSRVTPVSLNRATAGQFSPEEQEWLDTLAGQLRPLN